MKNLTLVTLKKVGEINSSLENRWRHSHDGYDAVSCAKASLFIGSVLMITALGCVGFELWKKYPIFSGDDFSVVLILPIVFIGAFFLSLLNLLGNTMFGTRLDELCKIFGCNFGQLAVMDYEIMVNLAKDILDDMVYDLVCKENKYKPWHPITVVARMEYIRVQEVFVDLGIHDGKVDDLFARANEKFALAHKQQVAASV